MVYFALVSNGLNREVIWTMPTFGSFWGHIWSKCGYLTSGLPMYMVTSDCLLLLLKKYYHALSWMYNCGYISLSNGPNGTYLDNTNIWGHFWTKCAYLPNPRVPMYRATHPVVQLILKKYHLPLSWMYICGYFALSNGPNKEVLSILPIFG